MKDYNEFLKDKMAISHQSGFDVSIDEVTPTLYPHVKDSVVWAIKGGKRAIFSNFGMHKTVTQLEILRLIIKHKGGKGLIVCPKRVVNEFKEQAVKHMNLNVEYVRRMSEIEASDCDILITNYERVRDGDIKPEYFTATSLDEASVLRGYGTKTYQTFLPLFQDVPYRFVATATPSPNRYKELIHYAGYLDIMDTGQALAQPLYSKVLTPNGWEAMGNIKAGDNVISADGKPTKVLSIHPQGEKDVYRVTFSDGTSTDCTEEHLWETQTQYERNAYSKYAKRNGEFGDRWKEYFTTKQTKDIATSLICESTGSKNHSIPLVKPIEFNDRDVLVDPYLMGILLGDGHIRNTSVTFSTADDCIANEVIRIASNDGLMVCKSTHERKDGTPNYDYSISTTGKQGGSGYGANKVLAGMQKYGLCEKRAWEKFIPEDYLFNSVDVRLSVLQGLMDTDGTISVNIKTRSPKFVTTSIELANNVVAIVQSLGGTAQVRERQGVAPSGENGRMQHHVSIMLPDRINPFRMKRKAELVVPRKKYKPMRYITSIEKIGRHECQCIYIEDDRHLYVTDSYILTHNTRFFQRDSTKANNLTLYEHKENEFWLWMSTWALFLTKPSDLGYPDVGYDLPKLIIHEEVVNADHTTAGADRDGQVKMFREAALGLSQAAKEKRDNLDVKVDRVLEIINRPENKDDHFIFWHDLEAERHALTKAVAGSKAVYGSQDDDEADQIVDDFKHGRLKYLSAKPEMLGEGINFQYHCHKMIMFIDYKFNDKFQAIHRVYRFMQEHDVHVYFVYAESEAEIFKSFMEKWQLHNNMIDKMVDIIKRNGLNSVDVGTKLMRWMFASREERISNLYTSINNDCVLETQQMKENSVDLIVTSIPFSNHYEYTPTYNDFGHNEDNDKFFEQMDYLTPELLRILKPGRVAAIHVKDRILFGNATGLGMPSLDPFHAMSIFHYTKHGFVFFGMITVDTDVVRENNQTYRLGYTEMRKDGTKMGVGCPEYVLLFRKLPTDTTRAYADTPVQKAIEEYSLARWQIDAHAAWKSSGNTLLTPDDMRSMGIDKIRHHFRKYSKENIYNYERHVEFAETLEEMGKLPKTFMAIDPVSKKDNIWDDVTRMRTLNSRQTQKKQVNHICPLQLDIVERLIERYSNKGDVVFDPFGGIATVPYCAVKMGRKGLSTELNYDYYRDGLGYLKEAELEVTAPTLFDLIELEN